MTTDEWRAWLAELRERHEAGEFLEAGPWWLSDGVLLRDVDLQVGYMLRQVAEWEAMNEAQRALEHVHRAHVARVLELLWERIGRG